MTVDSVGMIGVYASSMVIYLHGVTVDSVGMIGVYTSSMVIY